MNDFARYLLPFAAAATLAACNVQQSVDDAVAEVGAFHADLDAGNFDAIWRDAAPEMRKAAEKQQLVALLAAVQRKLGKVRESKQVGWNANATTGGSFVTVTMQTAFEKGSGTEQFVYRKGEGDRLALVGYTIQSQEMMLN